MSAEDRARLLREPFRLLSPAVEERFGPSLAGWMFWTNRRWFQSRIFPLLVPALRPLKPTREELELVLRELQSQGHRIGEKLPLEDLLAALCGESAPQADPGADTMIPPLAGAFAGTAVKAPVPPPATAALAAGAAGTKRNPELKLKFGGVRHRVSRDDGEITIGRDPASVIHVGAPHVSRHHATIIWMEDGYPLLVNLSQSGTSIQPEGRPAMTLDGSTRLEGAGRIGLFSDFPYAEANNSVVVFEAKWPPRN